MFLYAITLEGGDIKWARAARKADVEEFLILSDLRGSKIEKMSFPEPDEIDWDLTTADDEK